MALSDTWQKQLLVDMVEFFGYIEGEFKGVMLCFLVFRLVHLLLRWFVPTLRNTKVLNVSWMWTDLSFLDFLENIQQFYIQTLVCMQASTAWPMRTECVWVEGGFRAATHQADGQLSVRETALIGSTAYGITGWGEIWTPVLIPPSYQTLKIRSKPFVYICSPRSSYKWQIPTADPWYKEAT